MFSQYFTGRPAAVSEQAARVARSRQAAAQRERALARRRAARQRTSGAPLPRGDPLPPPPAPPQVVALVEVREGAGAPEELRHGESCPEGDASLGHTLWQEAVRQGAEAVLEALCLDLWGHL